MTALIPIPKPIMTELIKFCIGNTSDMAVIAFSLILATKKLSTMLYSEFTSIDITMGRAIVNKSFSMFCFFI